MPDRSIPDRGIPDRDPGLGDPDPVDDELIGLDRDDPEVQAFAAHLSRMHRRHPAFTVEGYLDDVGTFADAANRAQGERYWAAVAVVVALLAVVVYLVVDCVAFVLQTWF
jgi:hypothetical protein